MFRYTVFPNKPAGTPCVGGGRWAVGGWRLAVGGGWWRLVAGGGGWWWVAAVGGWGLVVDGGWQWFAVGGWRRLAVGGPLGRSLRAVLNKKKSSSLRTPLPPQPQDVSAGATMQE